MVLDPDALSACGRRHFHLVPPSFKAQHFVVVCGLEEALEQYQAPPRVQLVG